MRSLLAIIALIFLCGIAWFLFPKDANHSESVENAATANNRQEQEQTLAQTETAAEEKAVEPTVQTPFDEAGQAQLERTEKVAQVKIRDPEGHAVAAKSILIEANETFLEHMAGASRIGIAIYYDSILQESESKEDDGVIAILPEGNKADFHLVIADGFQPFVEAWSPLAADQTRDIVLNPVEPILVTVVSDQGEPLEGAEVWLRWSGENDWNEATPLFERFQDRCYQEATLTDQEGKANLVVCFPGDANGLFVRPPGDFSTTTAQATSGTPIEIECAAAFTIQGVVWVDGKVPENEVRFAAVMPGGNSSQLLETARAKEEGHYVLKGIPAAAEPVLIQVYGNGITHQTKSIRRPKAGAVYEIDFHLNSAVGGQLTFQDPWGAPITEATVFLQTNEVNSYLNSFDLDEKGQAKLPANFKPGAEFWMDLQMDTQNISSTEPFRAGEEQVVVIENLARIDRVTIPQEVLGEATISSIYWKSLSPEGSGHRVWAPEDSPSPLLNSGFGFLGAKLSDGRRFVEQTSLTAGEIASFDFDLHPAAIHLQLLQEAAVKISLKNKEGLTIATLKDVSGDVEIPCWAGNFTLDVYWAQGFHTFPGLQVSSGGVDLGPIQPMTGGVVQGKVLDAGGAPYSWVKVHLTSADSHTSWTYETDSDGSYHFTDVPPGFYYLLADPSFYYPGFSAMRMETLTMSQIEPVVERDLLMSPNDNAVTCTSAFARPGALFVLATTQNIVSKSASTLGPTTLPAQEDTGWLAAVSIVGNTATSSGKNIPQGPGVFDLPIPTAPTKTVRLVDGNHQPQTGLLLRLELNGFPMTKRLATDADGRLKLQMDASLPWTIHVRNDIGYAWVFPLNELQDGQDVVIQKQVETKLLVIQDTEGRPIPWAVVQPDSMRNTYRATKDGEVAVPVGEGWHFATAEGYVGQWISEDLPSPVILPEALHGVTVQAPPSTVRLEWKSTPELDPIWPDYVERSAGSTGVFDLPLLAAGAMEMTALDANGAVLAVQSYSVRKDDQALVLLE